MFSFNNKIWKIFVSYLCICAGYINCFLPSQDDTIGDIFFRSEARNLEAPTRHNNTKCHKEIPVILFQTEINEKIRGNGSSPYFHRVEVCCPGFKVYKYDKTKCVADCGESCKDGFCVAPNVCQCFSGFVANEFGHCLQTCPVECPNGRCFLNGTCQCNLGYELDPTQTYCKAVCKNGCGHNQICLKPNECVCRDGYKMTESGCQPICIPDCGYGKCVAPNQCECLPKYYKKNNVCQVFSYLRCDNGIMESEYNCNCRDGFKYDGTTTTCLPDCGDDCKFGICVAPGECRCFKHYERKDATCVPICENGCGFYGKCIKPNVCGCGEDNQKCINGACNSRGQCICTGDLTKYINGCVNHMSLPKIITSHDDQMKYNSELNSQFNKIIGSNFLFNKN